MKLLITLILILSISQIYAQKYINYVGSHSATDCSDHSNGVGFTFSNNFCEGGNETESNYLFKILPNGNFVQISEYASSGTNKRCTGKADFVETIPSGCVLQPQFMSEPDGFYSQLSFSNLPIYEQGAIVFAQFTDNTCTTLQSAVTYSNGYVNVDNTNYNTTYMCVNSKPELYQCYDGQCNTKSFSYECNLSGLRVFCNV